MALSDFGMAVSEDDLASLNVAISHHFYRSGLFELADSFIQVRTSGSFLGCST